MTITLTKTKLALAVLVAALVVPATALADHVFDDVPDDAFYAEPVDWAFTNNITTGKSPTSFAPLDNVTRGETVTFLQRYHDNIAEPADEALQQGIDANATTAAAAQADVDALAASAPTTYWAWVTRDGNLYTNSSSDGVTASRSLTGEYVVTFPVDVNKCSWAVSHRSVDGLLFPIDPNFTNSPAIDLSTRSSGFFPTLTYHNADIRVQVTDSNGANAKNTEFNLTVTCFPS